MLYIIYTINLIYTDYIYKNLSTFIYNLYYILYKYNILNIKYIITYIKIYYIIIFKIYKNTF